MKSNLSFYSLTGFFFFALLAGLACSGKVTSREQDSQFDIQPSRTSNLITMFIVGDVMTGRGIDQVLPHPSDPVIHESYMKSARGYVDLAEKAYGPIQKPIDFSYIWGDALVDLERVDPDLRLINLETSVTTSNDYWEGKGIHYRMHPENIYSLTAAKIDYCSFANNHILDWGFAGLTETLETLKKVNIKIAGAGLNLQEAESPAVMKVKGKGRGPGCKDGEDRAASLICPGEGGPPQMEGGGVRGFQEETGGGKGGDGQRLEEVRGRIQGTG